MSPADVPDLGRIYRMLYDMGLTVNQAVEWMMAPNKGFDGASPFQVACRYNDGTQRVIDYLMEFESGFSS